MCRNQFHDGPFQDRYPSIIPWLYKARTQSCNWYDLALGNVDYVNLNLQHGNCWKKNVEVGQDVQIAYQWFSQLLFQVHQMWKPESSII